MTNCNHSNLTPTGEMRPWAKCKGDPNAPGVKAYAEVMRCNDCGAYIQRKGDEVAVVGPPTPIEQIIPAIKAGQLTKEAALAQCGHFTPAEKQVIEELHVCLHEQTEPLFVVKRCVDCGQTIQVKVEEVNPDE
jgi:hypothetical protein